MKNGQGCWYCARKRTEEAHIIDLNFKKEEHKDLCDTKGFIYIDTIRKNKKITIEFICKKHTELGNQFMTLYNMQRDINGCQYCSGKNLPEWYVLNKAKNINPFIKIISPYTNLTTKMDCLCEKHNVPTSKSMQDILKGYGCYKCGIDKLSKKSFLSKEEYQKRVCKYNNNLEVIQYNGMENLSTFRCKICLETFESNSQYASNFYKQCPFCERYYKGEKSISNFLQSLKIEFITQKRFKDCKDKRTLPFDFYIPNLNICIEYDGIQHYEQRHGWTELSVIKKHDEIKNTYCNNHGINLIRVPYWEYNNIDTFLFEKIKEITK